MAYQDCDTCGLTHMLTRRPDIDHSKARWCREHYCYHAVSLWSLIADATCIAECHILGMLVSCVELLNFGISCIVFTCNLIMCIIDAFVCSSGQKGGWVGHTQAFRLYGHLQPRVHCVCLPPPRW